jgi:hypothetical protein
MPPSVPIRPPEGPCGRWPLEPELRDRHR